NPHAASGRSEECLAGRASSAPTTERQRAAWRRRAAVIKQTLVASLICVWLAVVSGAQEPVSFAKDIRPILQASCERCHGDLQVSGLDLRTRDGALKGGSHGVAIVPGSADQSRLYRRI